MRDGLKALFATLPVANRILEASDEPEALSSIKEYGPGILVLETAAVANVAHLIFQSRRENLDCISLALVDYSEQIQEMELCGADVVHVKGYPAARLLDEVSQLIWR